MKKNKNTTEKIKHVKIAGLDVEEKKISEKVAVISPGFRATKNEKYLRKIKDEIEKRGISTIIFTFRMKKITIESELNDLNKMVKKAEKYEKIALVGHSFGGLISMIYAGSEKEKKIKALVLLSAPASEKSNGREWVKKLKKELKEDKAMLKIRKIKIPTLIIQGVFDERISKNSGRILKKKINGSELKEFKTDHFYTNKRELKKISMETAKWIERQLK
ncbi:MAG: alpha/beta fold hydrolase [Candidatus Marsarchaeota archaeon]|nr:alpha/beta fold hydrolase [Candidatus Marsarchaeota archaeon]